MSKESSESVVIQGSAVDVKARSIFHAITEIEQFSVAEMKNGPSQFSMGHTRYSGMD